MDDCRNGPFLNTLFQTTSATSFSLTSIIPGTICKFRMQVQNVIGLSPYSDIQTIQFAEVPNAPTTPTFIERSGGDTSIGLTPYIQIAWQEP